MGKRRADLASEYAHVTQRGIGRRLIFEDDRDRRRFLSTFASKLPDSHVSVLAWCLMGNHFHLLVQALPEDISKLMQRVGISYAQYFNGRHGHVGKVFQGRFSTTTVASEAHLLATVRYIHRNARDAGQVVQEYPWSSYRELAGLEGAEGKGICDVEHVLSLFGGREPFVEFHADESVDDWFCRIDGFRPRFDDAWALAVAKQQFGADYADRICSLPKDERDDALRLLKDLGLSVRQIERLTGIGRGIIGKA